QTADLLRSSPAPPGHGTGRTRSGLGELVWEHPMGSVNGARSPHLAISVQAWGEAGATLAIAGDLDMAGLAALRHALRHALREGHRHLVFDLSDTTFLDYAALAEVLQAVRALQDYASAADLVATAGGTVGRL